MTNTEHPTSTATQPPAATPTPAPPPKAEPGQPDLDTYPTSIAELNLDLVQRIDELEMLAAFQEYSIEGRDALEKELTVVKELLRQALTKQGRKPEYYDLITDAYQTPSGNFSWKVYVRSQVDGSVLWPRDSETGLPVIDGSVYQYLNNLNSENLGFTLEPFTPPEGFSSGQIVHTRSKDGWPVAGLTDEDGQLVGWLNLRPDDGTIVWLDKNDEPIEAAVMKTEVPTPEPTPEVHLGGENVTVMWGGRSVDGGFSYDIPDKLKPYLIPMSSDDWESLEKMTLLDGTELDYGDFVHLRWASQDKEYVIKVIYVAGMVEFKQYDSIGGTIFVPIYAYPGTEGTVYIAGNMRDAGSHSSEMDISTFYNLPNEWFNEEDIVNYDTYLSMRNPSGSMSVDEYRVYIQEHIGKPIIALFGFSKLDQDVNKSLMNTKPVKNTQIEMSRNPIVIIKTHP